MYKSAFMALSITAMAATTPAVAQSDSIPGVTEIAPGVRHIDGAAVPSTSLKVSELEAVIEETHSFSAARELLGENGVVSVGPQNTTTYMYKIQNSETGEDLVVILFVKRNKIVDYLIT